MREDEVDAAAVDVDRRRAQQAQRHRRALEVPARTARRLDLAPRGLARPGRFPQREVARVLLRILFRVHARAVLHALEIEVRELAVVLHRGDLEVDRSVAHVGVAVRAERGDEIGHRRDVRGIGRAGIFLDVFDAEGARVLAERGDELIGVRAQIHAGRLRAVDRLVVHVGEVDDLLHLVAEQVLQRPAEDVLADEGPEVPDVSAGVDRQAAGVDAGEVAGRRGKALFASRERVIETQTILYLTGTGQDARKSRPLREKAISSSPACAAKRSVQAPSALRYSAITPSISRSAASPFTPIEPRTDRTTSPSTDAPTSPPAAPLSVIPNWNSGAGTSGRFYSESLPNSTRARAQSASICDFSASSD